MGVKRTCSPGNDDFEKGRLAGLAEAADSVRHHLALLVERHGQDSPYAEAARLDLYCLERRLRGDPALSASGTSSA